MKREQYQMYLNDTITDEIMTVTKTDNVTAAKIHYTMTLMFEIRYSEISTASLHRKMKQAAEEFFAEEAL
jgi:predicted transglutaminase-like protease